MHNEGAKVVMSQTETTATTQKGKVIYLASSQAWYALRSAIWSLWRVPENCLCTQPSLLRSDGVSNGSGKLVLAAIVHIASPQLKDNLK